MSTRVVYTYVELVNLAGGRGRASYWFSDFNSHIVLSMDAINVVAHRIVERALVAARPPEVTASGFQPFAAGRAMLGVAQAAAPAPLLPACVVPGNHGALVVLVRVHAIQATPACRALSLFAVAGSPCAVPLPAT